MSVSYCARALIGVRLSHQDLFVQKKVKAFEHPFSETDDVNFDPKTGRPLWRMGDVCRLNAYAGIELEDFSCVEPIADLDGLYCFHNGNDRAQDRQYLIGLFAVEEEEDDYHSSTGNFRHLTPEYTSKSYALCQKVLQPVGLWKVENFGIHVMQYVSC